MVSVIIYTYNSKLYLRRCVLSILEQTYEHFEIIVVDDSSSDESPYDLMSLIDMDERIQVVKFVAKKGTAKAKNAGFYRSSGEYVMFLDSHDCLEPGALAQMINNAEEYCSDIVIGNFKYFSTECRVVDDSVYKADDILKCTRFAGILANKLWKSELLCRNGLKFRNIMLGENIVFFDIYLSRCSIVSTISDFVVRHESYFDNYNRDGETDCNPFGIIRAYCYDIGNTKFAESLYDDEIQFCINCMRKIPICAVKQDRKHIIKSLHKVLVCTQNTDLLKLYEKEKRKCVLYTSSIYSWIYRKNIVNYPPLKSFGILKW